MKLKENKPELKLPDFKAPQISKGNEYGINIPQLEQWIQVRWSSGWSPVVWFEVIPTTTGIWNYDMVSSAITFIPKYIRIQCIFGNGGVATMSDMVYDGTNSGWIFTISNTPDFSFSRIIRLFTSGSNNFGANPVEFIQGWVRINVTDAAFWGWDPVNCIITAYP